MHGRFQLLFQRGVNAPLALDARKPLERGRNHADMEMGFTLTAIVTRGAGMAGMAGAFVLHVQRHWGESRGEFLPDGVSDFHHFVVCFRRWKVKRYLPLSFRHAAP